MNDTEWCLIALISLEAMSEERAQARSHASFNQIEATKINQCQWVIKWLVKCASEKHKIQLKLFFYVRNNVVKDILNWSHLDSYISFEIAIVIAYMFSAL